MKKNTYEKRLKYELKQVAKGKQFIIQGGDCAETFRDFSDDMIKIKLKVEVGNFDNV